MRMICTQGKIIMMMYLLLKKLKELGPSTPLTPNDFQTPQYIPNYGKICLTKGETEYVYSCCEEWNSSETWTY